MKFRFLSVLMMFGLSFNVFAQNSKFGETAEDSVQCVLNYSLYSEYVKQKAYSDAVKGWRNVLEFCPKLSKNTYINGAKMFKSFIKDAEDEKVKQAYVDTLLWIYDQRIVHFGEEGKVLEYKGGDMLKYREDSAVAANVILKKAMELNGKIGRAHV